MLIKEENNKEGIDRRRSFSFSSLDFNSSFGPLSSDEDESTIDRNIYNDDENDNDAYIEINLDHPREENDDDNNNFIADDDDDEENKAGDEDNDLEFRVSFLEAALPFVGISSPPSNLYSSPVAWPPAAPNKRKMPLFLPVNHLINTLEGSPLDDGNADDHCNKADDSKQLVVSMSNRKGSRMTAGGGGMMNMMVKFRYVMSFRWMVASSMWKIGGQSPSSSSSFCNTKLSKQLLLRQNKQPQVQHNNDLKKSRSPSVMLLRLGVKLNTIKGLMISNHNSSKNSKDLKSCPNSIKSSPLHHQGGTLIYTKDHNSVQAAIAHCKKSFGRSEDFSF